MEAPKNGEICSVPQLGQPLFVKAEDGQMIDCGQVIACKLCWDVVTLRETIRVRTTEVFGDGFDVRLASGVFMPKIKW